MVRISAKAEYASRAVLHMALKYDTKQPAQLTEISRAQKIPRDFLIQVMSQLTKSGLVTSIRGAKGGYVLGRKPHEVKLMEIIEVIDGPVSEFRCDKKTFNNCVGNDVCVLRPVWEKLVANAKKKLSSISFHQLTARKK